MEHSKHTPPAAVLQRQLANLKLISRLLGHELHTQSGSKAIALSREETQEIQTTIDLYIEEVSRWQGGQSNSGGLGLPDTRMVGTRN